jgi:hypothetical protein
VLSYILSILTYCLYISTTLSARIKKVAGILSYCYLQVNNINLQSSEAVCNNQILQCPIQKAKKTIKIPCTAFGGFGSKRQKIFWEVKVCEEYNTDFVVQIQSIEINSFGVVGRKVLGTEQRSSHMLSIHCTIELYSLAQIHVFVYLFSD